MRQIENEEVHRVRSKKKRGEQNEIVTQNRIVEREVERQREQSLWQHRLRIGERVLVGIENVRVEQVERISDERVTDPANDPRVEQAVLLVLDCIGNVQDKRIRHHASQYQEERDGKGVAL